MRYIFAKTKTLFRNWYLKSIFPKAEETLILDVLANKDNNVQKASEELISMGFPKKETLVTQPKKVEKDAPPAPKKVVTIMKSLEEKNQLKQSLQKKYSSVAERVIGIALESVDYHEERAEQILSAVLVEEEAPRVAKVELKEVKRPSLPDVKKGACVAEPAATAPPAAAPARRLKTWSDRLKPILKTSSSSEPKYKSQYCAAAAGANPTMRQGPNDTLLLMDYMPWNGPNPDYRGGQMVKAEGPESRDKSASLARGPSGVAKGPGGLAKGSFYQKLNKKSAKIIG